MSETSAPPKWRHAVLAAQVRRGKKLILTYRGGQEAWALSDGTKVLQEEAAWLRHTLKLKPSDPGLFPGAAPQSYSL